LAAGRCAVPKLEKIYATFSDFQQNSVLANPDYLDGGGPTQKEMTRDIQILALCSV
jgi:hypothetical protein